MRGGPVDAIVRRTIRLSQSLMGSMVRTIAANATGTIAHNSPKEAAGAP